jgi:membrane dipeptidase
MSGSLDRRRFIFLSTLAAANAAVPRVAAEAVETAAAPPPSPRWVGYDQAILIDALGGPGGGGDGPLLTATQIADVRASGLTALNLTVGALGNGADVFEQTFKTIGSWEREIDAHPDVLMKVKSAADLERAKASGRLGIIYGFRMRRRSATIRAGWSCSAASASASSSSPTTAGTSSATAVWSPATRA